MTPTYSSSLMFLFPPWFNTQIILINTYLTYCTRKQRDDFTTIFIRFAVAIFYRQSASIIMNSLGYGLWFFNIPWSMCSDSALCAIIYMGFFYTICRQLLPTSYTKFKLNLNIFIIYFYGLANRGDRATGETDFALIRCRAALFKLLLPDYAMQ